MQFLNKTEQKILLTMQNGQRIADYQNTTNGNYAYFCTIFNNLNKKGLLHKHPITKTYSITELGQKAREVVICLNDINGANLLL